MILKKFIINLFINIKNQLFNIIDDEMSSRYTTCFTEIIKVLKSTLSQIENIYYRHILFPKLQEYYATRTTY